jgi:hypothetical protein
MSRTLLTSAIIGVMRATPCFAFVLFLIHPLQGQNWWLREAGDGARVIVETGVTCEVLSGVKIALPLGMPIRAGTEISESGKTFYSGFPAMAPNSRCRVLGQTTTVWHTAEPDSLLLAILDHALAKQNATFEDTVAAENYLINTDARWRTQAGRDQISGQLQFRWLQLISRAVGLEGFNENNPLVESWILGHEELLDRLQGEWSVPPRHYWHVYQSNKTAPWAEELAWYVANLPVPHDECETTCILAGYIGDRILEYWTRFPSGPHIGEALVEASRMLREVDPAICDKDDLKLLADIRDSLSKVTHPSKQEILKSLADIERTCAK